VHARRLCRYFNPYWYSKSIIPYIPYDLVVLFVAFEEAIDLHPCFSHLANFLEHVFVYVFLHPCYLGFVTASKIKIYLWNSWRKSDRKSGNFFAKD
jgi:hypothetical protein